MTILILGGRGKTSSRLASILSTKAPEIPFIVASRTTSPLSPHKQAIFDWHDESTWGQPFEMASTPSAFSLGPISAVYIVSPSVVDLFPLAKRLIDFAREKGVRRFVLLSASTFEKGGPLMGKVHEYLAGLGEEIEWTVLRPTWFMQNVSEAQFLPFIKGEDKIYSSTGEGKIPFVSTEDIARVAFHALTDKRPHNTDHLILGPELLSYGDIADILSSVLGRKITHVNLSEADYVTWLMRATGVSENYAKMLAGLEIPIRSRELEEVNDVVERVTGKAPMTFREFAEVAKECWL
ncbi:hypothetical protein PAAG_05656 [Paracoccidioides lutzii Pb01]|uniref:NmrA-like domain-containing protein n=1 Tax=Paracoccidioides lutzii (strain ATCC MYA-826 / Pb01) TaxID=502779 RepID=C1H4G3_PARBA|nr:hypothetical protein PAAG_05656 [Paracoccidioides lutzii Pb01]EEH34607.1 hypothetical protein PAAG_05656 [Paracoccidioides lutzii Pb01]